jgi:hypothetical protein
MKDITGDEIIYYLFEDIDVELEKTMRRVLRTVGRSMGDQIGNVGIEPGRVFTSIAYTDISDRYFRITIKLQAKPFKFLRKQVDEVTKKQYREGIKRELDDPNTETEWVQ